MEMFILLFKDLGLTDFSQIKNKQAKNQVPILEIVHVYHNFKRIRSPVKSSETVHVSSYVLCDNQKITAGSLQNLPGIVYSVSRFFLILYEQENF